MFWYVLVSEPSCPPGLTCYPTQKVILHGTPLFARHDLPFRAFRRFRDPGCFGQARHRADNDPEWLEP